MIPDYIASQIKKDDDALARNGSIDFSMPIYNPEGHYLELSKSKYYHAIIILRHYVKIVSDYYFGTFQNAKNIDLFMFTSSVSSPVGPGSDSEWQVPSILDTDSVK